MDIPEKDHNKSDEEGSSEHVPDMAVDDSASNNIEDDVVYEASRLGELFEDLNLTPTNRGTRQLEFSEPPSIPRIKELRSETLDSPPKRKPSRASRKLDFPLEVHPPRNSPEEMSPEDTYNNSPTFGQELYESLSGTSNEQLRSSPRTPTNAFNLVPAGCRGRGPSTSTPNPGLTNASMAHYTRLMSDLLCEAGLVRNAERGSNRPIRAQDVFNLNMESDPEDEVKPESASAESATQQTERTLEESASGSDSKGSSNPNPGLINTAKQCDMDDDVISESVLCQNVESANQQTKRTLEGSGSDGKGPSNPNPGLCIRHCNQSYSGVTPSSVLGHNVESANQQTKRTLEESASGSGSKGPSNPNPGIINTGEIGSGSLPESLLGQCRHCSQQIKWTLEGSASGSSCEGPSNPSKINTAKKYDARVIGGIAIPESVLGQNVESAIQQTKRTLDRSSPGTSDSGSPSVVKRNRRVSSPVPEERPAAARRSLSYEDREQEPVVRRESRKRSHSSGLMETTEIRGEKQPKKK